MFSIDMYTHRSCQLNPNPNTNIKNSSQPSYFHNTAIKADLKDLCFSSSSEFNKFLQDAISNKLSGKDYKIDQNQIQNCSPDTKKLFDTYFNKDNNFYTIKEEVFNFLRSVVQEKTNNKLVKIKPITNLLDQKLVKNILSDINRNPNLNLPEQQNRIKPYEAATVEDNIINSTAINDAYEKCKNQSNLQNLNDEEILTLLSGTTIPFVHHALCQGSDYNVLTTYMSSNSCIQKSSITTIDGDNVLEVITTYNNNLLDKTNNTTPITLIFEDSFKITRNQHKLELVLFKSSLDGKLDGEATVDNNNLNIGGVSTQEERSVNLSIINMEINNINGTIDENPISEDNSLSYDPNSTNKNNTYQMSLNNSSYTGLPHESSYKAINQLPTTSNQVITNNNSNNYLNFTLSSSNELNVIIGNVINGGTNQFNLSNNIDKNLVNAYATSLGNGSYQIKEELIEFFKFLSEENLKKLGNINPIRDLLGNTVSKEIEKEVYRDGAFSDYDKEKIKRAYKDYLENYHQNTFNMGKQILDLIPVTLIPIEHHYLAQVQPHNILPANLMLSSRKQEFKVIKGEDDIEQLIITTQYENYITDEYLNKIPIRLIFEDSFKLVINKQQISIENLVLNYNNIEEILGSNNSLQEININDIQQLDNIAVLPAELFVTDSFVTDSMKDVVEVRPNQKRLELRLQKSKLLDVVLSSTK